MNEMITERFDIWIVGPNKWGIVVKNKVRLMYRLNAYLGRYSSGTVFTDSDEPIFFFDASQIEHIRRQLFRRQQLATSDATPRGR